MNVLFHCELENTYKDDLHCYISVQDYLKLLECKSNTEETPLDRSNQHARFPCHQLVFGVYLTKLVSEGDDFKGLAGRYNFIAPRIAGTPISMVIRHVDAASSGRDHCHKSAARIGK